MTIRLSLPSHCYPARAARETNVDPTDPLSCRSYTYHYCFAEDVVSKSYLITRTAFYMDPKSSFEGSNLHMKEVPPEPPANSFFAYIRREIANVHIMYRQHGIGKGG